MIQGGITMQRFCESCGKQLSQTSKFCPNCGQSVTESPDTDLSNTHEEKLTQSISQTENSVAQTKLQSDSNVYVPDDSIITMLLTGTSRLNRLRYFKRILAVSILNSIIAFFIMNAINPMTLFSYFEYIPFFQLLLITPMIISGYSLTKRRSHDIGHGNLLPKCYIICWILPGLISLTDLLLYSTVSSVAGVINFIISLYLLFRPGEKGPNKYGPDPLG